MKCGRSNPLSIKGNFGMILLVTCSVLNKETNWFTTSQFCSHSPSIQLAKRPGIDIGWGGGGSCRRVGIYVGDSGLKWCDWRKETPLGSASPAILTQEARKDFELCGRDCRYRLSLVHTWFPSLLLFKLILLPVPLLSPRGGGGGIHSQKL